MTNRARAATRLDSTDEALFTDVAAYDHSQSLTGECSICMVECGGDHPGLLVVRLRQLPAKESVLNIQRNDPVTGKRTVGDTLQTMPLAFGQTEHNQIILPDEPMCLDCSRTIDESVLTRQAVSVAVPCVSLTVAANRKLVFKVLSRAFGDGILMHCWWQLYAAVIDVKLSESSGFADDNHPEMREALCYQLFNIITYVYTSDTLQALSSHRVVILDAITGVLNGTVMCDDEPTKAFAEQYQCEGLVRMVSMLNRCGYYVPDAWPTMFRRAILRQMVTTRMIKLRPVGVPTDMGYVSTRQFRTLLDAELTNNLFTTRHGVPIYGSARLLERNHTSTLIPKTLARTILQTFDHDTLDKVLSRQVLTLMAWNVSKIVTEPTNTTKALIELEEKTGHMYSALVEAYLPTDTVLGVINDQYKRTNVDEAHSVAVPFASTAGPSRVKCQSCGYRFLRNLADPTQPLTTEYIEEARRRRAAHFAEVYRASPAGTPDNKSTHCNLHHAVQKTFRVHQSVNDNVAAAMKYLCVDDGRGNIFTSTLEKDLFSVVCSFVPFAERFASRMHLRSDKNRVTFEEALRIELQLE